MVTRRRPEDIPTLASLALCRMDEKGETAAQAAEAVTGGNKSLDAKIVRWLQGKD